MPLPQSGLSLTADYNGKDVYDIGDYYNDGDAPQFYTQSRTSHDLLASTDTMQTVKYVTRFTQAVGGFPAFNAHHKLVGVMKQDGLFDFTLDWPKALVEQITARFQQALSAGQGVFEKRRDMTLTTLMNNVLIDHDKQVNGVNKSTDSMWGGFLA